MFNNKKDSSNLEELKSQILVAQNRLEDVKSQHSRDIADLKSKHAREVLDLEKKIEYVESDEIVKLKTRLEEVEKKNAVLEKSNEHLEKMTDLNADIVDVKEIIAQLIRKLPEINLNSLTIQSAKE